MLHSKQTNYPDMDQKEHPDPGRCDRAKKRKRASPSGARESKWCKMDLESCNGSEKRKRSRRSAQETQHKKTDPGRGSRAKRRDRSASGAPEHTCKNPDLGRQTRSKKTERSASGAPENTCKNPDLGRRKRSKKAERSASGAPESKRKKSDLRKSKTATKRSTPASSAQEDTSCKLDRSRTSGHKRELQVSHRKSTARRVEDDEEGHLICQRGDTLNARYEVVALLGEGKFAKVVECIDHKEEGRHVAVKIARNTYWSSEAARAEIQVLEDLKASDPSNAYHCVQMLGWFEYRGHVCIVFELLGLSTFDFMRFNNFMPFSLDDIRHMAYQICTSVNFLHMNKLTHTDVKSDNIVSVTSDYEEVYNPTLKRIEIRLRTADVRLVDFGCATYDHEHHRPIVTARAFRAPEVILELGWSQPCDVWSIGCTLLEYYLGDVVFTIDEDKMHLAMMERLLGPLPKLMAKRVVSPSKKQYFFKGWLAWDENSAAGQHVSRSCKPLKEYMMSQDSDHENLFDLIERMLEYDPAKRITLAEALEHPFFLPLKQDNST